MTVSSDFSSTRRTGLISFQVDWFQFIFLVHPLSPSSTSTSVARAYFVLLLYTHEDLSFSLSSLSLLYSLIISLLVLLVLHPTLSRAPARTYPTAFALSFRYPLLSYRTYLVYRFVL